MVAEKGKLGISWQKIASNGIVIADQAIVSGGNFLLGILLTRYLGLEQYGIYALLWMIVLIAISINQAFITKPLLSLAPKLFKKDIQPYLESLHFIQLIFAIMAGVFCFFVLLAGDWLKVSLPSNQLLMVIPLIVVSHLMYDYYRKYFFVKQNIRGALFTDGALYFLILTGVIGLGLTHRLSLLSCLGVIMVSQWLVVTVLFMVLSLNWPSKERVSQVFNRHVVYSKWLVGTSLLQWLSGNFFIIIGAAFLGAFAVGIIRMVQNIMGLTHVLFHVMENVVPVRAAQQFKKFGSGGLKQYLLRNTLQSSIVVGSILIGLSLFAPVIIRLLYGSEHVVHSWIVVSYCGIYVLVFLGHPLRFALRTLELTKPIFVAYVVAAGFSLIAAYPMLQWWGMSGLLMGLFVSQLIMNAIYYIYLQNYGKKDRSF